MGQKVRDRQLAVLESCDRANQKIAREKAASGLMPGMVVCADWAGGDRAKMRLVRHYEHPAGNGWEVNIYDQHGGRFSKVTQCVSDDDIAKATRSPQ